MEPNDGVIDKQDDEDLGRFIILTMKIGFNLLLWTGSVTDAGFHLFGKLKSVGYDGVEIPIFDVINPEHFKDVGRAIKDNGIERHAVTSPEDVSHDALSGHTMDLQVEIVRMKHAIPCVDIWREAIQKCRLSYRLEGRRPWRDRPRPHRAMDSATRQRLFTIERAFWTTTMASISTALYGGYQRISAAITFFRCLPRVIDEDFRRTLRPRFRSAQASSVRRSRAGRRIVPFGYKSALSPRTSGQVGLFEWIASARKASAARIIFSI